MTDFDPPATTTGTQRDDEQVAALALSVLQLFSERKTLTEVARTTLQRAFDELFPALGVIASNAVILEPLWEEDKDPRLFAGYRTDRLVDLMLERCRGVPARHYSAGSFLSTDVGAEAPRTIAVSIDEILQLVDEWGPLLLEYYQQHLTELWGQPTERGTNAWQRLSDVFKEALRRDCAQLGSEVAATVQAVLDYPDSGLRKNTLGDDTTEAFITFLYEDFDKPTPDDVVMLSMRRSFGEQTIALNYTLSSAVAVFDSPQAQANAWSDTGRSSGSRLRNYTPDEDIFDALTLCLLEYQLRAIGAINPTNYADVASLERRLAQVCSPTALLGAFRSAHETRLSGLQALLPRWLQDAALADRCAYSELLASLANVNRAGTFMTGIPALIDYADETLSALMMADDPARGEVCAGDFDVTLQRSVNSGFEIIDPPFPAPRYQSIKQTFAQLALRNIDGFPFVPSRITYRGAEPPAWATYAYLRELTTRADIGQHYPALLQRKLLDDPDESSRRRTRFSESLRILLPMYALELKIKNELTPRAYQCVKAALRPSVSEHRVAGFDVVVRPLAFQVRPDAKADEASNMFVIGREDVALGPQVLYRPTSPAPLLEFASHAELFDAIKQAGALQDSVLAALSTEARAIYANGGFQAPHSGRVIVGDFDILREPPPALLSSTPLPGDVCSTLYRACARALIDQAKLDSVSDAQSRWIGFKQFGWATFNVLLPLARGPLAVVGLLGQLLVSIDTLIKREKGENQWSAFAEMLMNLALVVVHEGPALRAFVPVAGAEVGAVKTVLASSPLGGKARLFYGWHSARSRFSAKALVNLDTFKLPAAPVSSVALNTGAYRGLYRDGGQMFACIEGNWFRVAARLDGVAIVDHAQPLRSGPWLKSDGQGRWKYDYRPRLLGGAGLSKRANERLEELKNKAGKLLAGFQKKLANARKEDSSGRPVADIESYIQRDAQAFEQCALELSQISRPLGDAAPHALIDQLKDSARQLGEQAALTRINVLLARLPTAGAVEFLLQAGAIRIRRIPGRKNLSKGNEGDFLQEYEIRDARGKELWYAHFHYLTKDAAPELFSKGHLKTAAQRRLGLEFQKAQQRAGDRVDSLWRGDVSLAVARKIFAASADG